MKDVNLHIEARQTPDGITQGHRRTKNLGSSKRGGLSWTLRDPQKDGQISHQILKVRKQRVDLHKLTKPSEFSIQQDSSSRVREFAPTRIAFQEMLKEGLPFEMKGCLLDSNTKL